MRVLLTGGGTHRLVVQVFVQRLLRGRVLGRLCLRARYMHTHSRLNCAILLHTLRLA